MLSFLARITISIIPWLVIASLLYVALFVKPSPVGQTVTPSAIESRDRFYGGASPAEGVWWIVGANGKIIRSDDAGESWVVQKAGADVNFQDIAAWDVDTAVAVGNAGTVVRSVDGGSTWTPVKVPSSEVANKLVDVKAYAGGEAWAVGEFGNILQSTDFGRTWAQVREPEDIIFNEIVRVDDDSLMVVGEFGTILRTIDNGQSWAFVDSPVGISITAVDFADAKVGLAGGLEGVLLGTIDGGASWFRIDENFEPPAGLIKPGMSLRDTWADFTSEHIFSLRWVESKNLWIATGAKGIWVTGSKDFSEWHSGRLDEREMGWHTDIVPVEGALVVTGKNLGVWDLSSWRVISGS
jgi:photosystem II stability/assembly factor-like uncharacterized protein